MSPLNRLASRALQLDVIFAIFMTIVVMAGSIPASREQPDMRSLDRLGWTLLAVAGLGLIVRRQWPIVAVAITFLATMTYTYFQFPYGPIFLYTMIAIYSLAAWRGLRVSLIVGAVLVAAQFPWGWWFESEPDSFGFSMFTSAVWLVSPIAVGVAVQTRRVADRRVHEQDRSRHLFEQRLRLAQEVHDTVGHSLAVISMNAGAALHVLTKTRGAPPQLEESLRAIRSASGSALDELRGVLTERAGKGVGALPELVGATNVDGLNVTLETTGITRPLPSAVDIAAYRIVQESLANVVRHANARHATVAVDYQAARLELRITDDGVGGSPHTGGSGLASMSERAKALMGTVEAAPLPEGGFQVRAVLPYGPGASP